MGKSHNIHSIHNSQMVNLAKGMSKIALSVLSLSVLFFFTLSALSSSAFGGIADVLPSKVHISPSLVESVTLIQKETATGSPRIALVKVDKGGSTDISSRRASSELYLGLHLDGEEFNIQGDYKIADLNEIESVSYDKRAKIIHLVYIKKNEKLQDKRHSLLIHIINALEEMSSDIVQKDETSRVYYLKEAVGLSQGYSKE